MSKMRDKINAVLIEKLSTLREAVGHQMYSDLMNMATDEIMELTRSKEEIIHVIGPNGQHRLIVDGKTTPWRSQNEIARNGDYIAATDFYIGQVPQVARIKEIESNHFMTTSAQNLSLVEVRYIKPE